MKEEEKYQTPVVARLIIISCIALIAAAMRVSARRSLRSPRQTPRQCRLVSIACENLPKKCLFLPIKKKADTFMFYCVSISYFLKIRMPCHTLGESRDRRTAKLQPCNRNEPKLRGRCNKYLLWRCKIRPIVNVMQLQLRLFMRDPALARRSQQFVPTPDRVAYPRQIAAIVCFSLIQRMIAPNASLRLARIRNRV